MKYVLYSENERLILTEEEIKNCSVIKDYQNGVIKVNYNNKTMFYVDNPNYKDKNILKFEFLIIQSIIFCNIFNVDLDTLFSIAESASKKRIKYFFMLSFNIILSNQISIYRKPKLIFGIFQFLSFCVNIKHLKNFLES